MSSMPSSVSRWNGHAGDNLWQNAGNWTAGVPGAGMIAVFQRGSVQVDLASAAAASAGLQIGQLAVAGGSVEIAAGTLRWRHVPYDPRFFSRVGLRVDGGATLGVAAGAALMGAHTVALGDASAATLDLRGALLDAQVYAGRLGAVSASVTGPGALWQTTGIDQSFQWGGSAAASLIVSAGGRVTDGVAWRNPNAASTMTIGGYAASGSVLVTDAGSLLQFQVIDVGGQYEGSLTVAAGAQVRDIGGNVGQSGDGTVLVTGPGSTWINEQGVFVHGGAPHGAVTLADYARMEFGVYGLEIGGTVALDSTATLAGSTIVMAGGALQAIPALAGGGTDVTIHQTIELSYNPDLGASNIGNFFDAGGGTTLTLAGVILPLISHPDPLAIGGGQVVLENPNNGDFAVSLFGGVLEVTTPAAAGSGGISFVDSSGATLQLDQPGTLADPISGFGLNPQDLIDLQAIAFGASLALAWSQTTSQAGTLQVSDGTRTADLTLEGHYSQAHFSLSADARGGSAVGYHS